MRVLTRRRTLHTLVKAHTPHFEMEDVAPKEKDIFYALGRIQSNATETASTSTDIKPSAAFKKAKKAHEQKVSTNFISKDRQT